MKSDTEEISKFRKKFPAVLASDEAIEHLLQDLRICNVLEISGWPELNAQQKAMGVTKISYEKLESDAQKLMLAEYDVMVFEETTSEIEQFRAAHSSEKISDDFLVRMSLVQGLIAGDYSLSVKNEFNWMFRITERFMRVRMVTADPPIDPDNYEFSGMQLSKWTPSYKSKGKRMGILSLG